MKEMVQEAHERKDTSHVTEEARIVAELMKENKRWNMETARIRCVNN